MMQNNNKKNVFLSGAYLEMMYSEEVVVAVATAIAILDVFFILVAVPESLPDKCKPSRGLTLEQVLREYRY